LKKDYCGRTDRLKKRNLWGKRKDNRTNWKGLVSRKTRGGLGEDR